MPAPSVTIADIERGISLYNSGHRPWRQTLNRVDWFIMFDSKLYPLKYTYALAVNEPPAEYTTNQMKSAMKGVQISFVSIKEQQKVSTNFEKLVIDSAKDPIARKKRLIGSNPKPEVTFTYQASYKRNPDVVAEVLERAAGVCECCNKPAPFKKSKDKSPYLEVHHIIFLAKGGDDTVENAEALCPNCHRRKHYG